MDAAAYRKFRVLSQYVAQLRAELAVLGLHEGRDFGLTGDADSLHGLALETRQGDANREPRRIYLP